jgi:predicted MFS family arabinose efflux permease
MEKDFHKHDITLILISSFFYMASPMLITPLIAGYSESLGASAAVMGLIGGLMNICSLFCRPFVGNLADQISKFKLSFFGALFITIACIGYILAWNPAVVVISRIINGVGFSCCSVCMSTWMSNLLPKDKIGSGMGMYGTMNALAMAAAPAIGVTMYQHLGYQAAFIIATGFSVAVIFLIQFVHDKGEPISLEKQVQPASPQKIEILDKKALPLAMIIMLFAIPYCATQSFWVSYVSVQKLDVIVSLFFPVYAIILFILRLSLRNLFDKKPFSFFMTASSISAGVSMLLLSVMQNNIFMFLAAAFMAGGYGIMCSVCQSTAILLAGEEKRGLANSTYYIGLDSGMALGPIIGGMLYGNVDIHYFYPFLLATVPLGVLVYWLNRSKLSRK